MPLEKQSLNNFLPDGFETLNQEGYKTNFSEDKIKTGYEKDIKDRVSGPNLNNFIDVVGKNTNILSKFLDFIKNMPVNSVLKINSNNQIDYQDIGDIDNKVSKSGDTMTGNLGIKNNSGAVIVEGTGYKGILAKCTDVDYTSTSQTSLAGGRLLSHDKNGQWFGNFQSGIGSTGSIFTGMYARRNVNGTNKECQIACDVPISTDARIYATANFSINTNKRVDVDMRNLSYNPNPTTAPSETTFCSALRSFDKDNKLVGQYVIYTDTGNNSNCAMSAIREVNGTNVSSTFTVMVKPDGTQTCSATGAVKKEIASWAYPSSNRIANPMPTTIVKDGNHQYVAPCNGMFTFSYSSTTGANAVVVKLNGVTVLFVGDSISSTHRMSGTLLVSKGMTITIGTDTKEATGTSQFWKAIAS